MTTDPSIPLERALLGVAGTITLVSVPLVAVVSPWFLALTTLVGINQWMYVAFGACPASIVLKRVFHLRSALDGPHDPAGTQA